MTLGPKSASQNGFTTYMTAGEQVFKFFNQELI